MISFGPGKDQAPPLLVQSGCSLLNDFSSPFHADLMRVFIGGFSWWFFRGKFKMIGGVMGTGEGGDADEVGGVGA